MKQVFEAVGERGRLLKQGQLSPHDVVPDRPVSVLYLANRDGDRAEADANFFRYAPLVRPGGLVVADGFGFF